MARPLRPLIQGDLDGLCGLYSLLNAVQWALHSCSRPARGRGSLPKLLSDAEQQALFDTLVTALGKRRPLATFVTGGIQRFRADAATARQSRMVVDTPKGRSGVPATILPAAYDRDTTRARSPGASIWPHPARRQ